MKIKEIELNNFRIYNGKNTVDLTTSNDRNIVIVSGENGFGKTTFLMSIVWCLYGKQMEQVDEMYKNEINSKKGGYNGYMISCLNKIAAANNITKFSVSLTLTGLEMPDELKCNEVKIIRSYDTQNALGDDLLILFDGKLIDEVFPTVPKEEKIDAEEFFIRERIMPIEIAKFFFFDAERIVAYAKLDSAEQQKNLAIAYSQVLGIQKYITLKETLSSLKYDYRKKGVNSEDTEEYNRLSLEIENSDSVLADLSQRIDELRYEIKNKKDDADSIQERLVLEGNTMTQEQLDEFRTKQKLCREEMDRAQSGLKDLYNYIPFGLSGELFAQLVDQVRKESEHRQKKVQIDIAEDRTNDLLNELDEESREVDFPIDRRVRRFYEDAVKNLIKKHFYSEFDDTTNPDFEELHNFTEVQSNTLVSLVSRIKSAQKDFTSLYNNYGRAKKEYSRIEMQIRDAEARAESPLIVELKEKKRELDEAIEELRQELIDKSGEYKVKSEALIANKKQKEVLFNRIQVSEEFKAKDKVITELIQSVDTFLGKFKEERKNSLQKRILANMNRLLHKKNLVKDVQVFIRHDIVDISLIGKDGKKQEVSDLSNGEKQMFSTSLLSALVEETGIQFPVFIDSPLQKFDKSHSKNILEKFYPNVSEQVVLFPLLEKELTEKEYMLIKDKTEKAILIKNDEATGSHFESTDKNKLFNA